ncbi:MAG TPA: TetR/AcrR family transcriptional regulator [Solirubrobacteraceae bacterium]|jgi:AcrR family transcriptional regulator
MTETAPKRRLPASERRRVIEEAACALFVEQGYAATTLTEIAARAGVTKQLLHRHFPSKRELHLTLLAAHRDALLDQLAQSLSGPGPLAQRIPRAVEEWLAHVQSNPYTWRLLFRDTTGDPQVQSFHRELQRSARAVNMYLIRSQTEVEVPERHVEMLAEFIRSAMVGLALWWTEHPEVPRAEIVDLATAALLGGVGSRREEDRLPRD